MKINTEGINAARQHYDDRATNRPTQIWKRPMKADPTQPSRITANGKGEKGAIPVHRSRRKA